MPNDGRGTFWPGTESTSTPIGWSPVVCGTPLMREGLVQSPLLIAPLCMEGTYFLTMVLSLSFSLIETWLLRELILLSLNPSLGARQTH